jgi:tetratricopeptide (TPR) repeat protein
MSDREDFVAEGRDDGLTVQPLGEGESANVSTLDFAAGGLKNADSLSILDGEFGAGQESAPPDSEADETLTPGWQDDPGQAPEAEDEMETDAAPVPSPPRRRGGFNPVGLGLLSFVSSLVAVLAAACAILTLTSGTILDAPQFLRKDLIELQWPAAMFAGALLLALLGAALVGHAVARGRRRYEVAEELLQKVGSLDPNDRDTWADPVLQEHPVLGRFLSELGQTTERKDIKLAGFIGLEGEVFRLEKSLAEGSRGDLAGRYDHQGVSRLADEILRLWDERQQVSREVTSLGGKLSDGGARLCNGLQEAANWNSAALDRLHVQLAALEKLAPSLKQLNQDVRHLARERQDIASLKGTLGAVREEFSILPAADSSETIGSIAENIKDLVSKGGSLAIKAATGVAALGPQGQELLGLTQELQSIVTEFRAASTRLEALFVNQEKAANVMASMRQKLDGVKNTIKPDPQAQQAWQSMNSGLADLTESLRGVAAAFGGLSPEFNTQTEHLNQLGRGCAALTGGRFAPAASSESAPTDGLAVERFEPFARADMTPGSPTRAGSPFVVPAEEPGVPADVPVRRMAPGLQAASPLLEPQVPPIAATPKPSPPPPQAPRQAPTKDSSLVEEEDRVYDLSEFDAVDLDQEPASADAEEDRIYDLQELGAVALD